MINILGFNSITVISAVNLNVTKTTVTFHGVKKIISKTRFSIAFNNITN
jgi:hypothetical protein